MTGAILQRVGIGGFSPTIAPTTSPWSFDVPTNAFYSLTFIASPPPGQTISSFLWSATGDATTTGSPTTASAVFTSPTGAPQTVICHCVSSLGAVANPSASVG